MLKVSDGNTLVSGSRLLFWIVILNIATALNTLGFWIGFFTEITFPVNELAPLIDNFEGYYAWERCFVVPDSILSLVTLLVAYRLLKNQADIVAMLFLAATSGAWIFLGVLDFTYGINNGMYTLGHPFSYAALFIGVSLPLVGGATLWSLHKVIYDNQV